MILIRIMSFVHSSGIFDLDFWLQQDSPSALRNTMNSPPEISPGWIVLRLRLDPAVLDFRRAEAQPASAPCRMNTKSRIHISLRKEARAAP